MGTDTIPPPLSAKFKSSFAYHTINVRLPIIIAQVVDSLVRQREEILKKFGEDASDDLKLIIGRLSKLRYEVQTDKPVAPLVSQRADVPIWNSELDVQIKTSGGIPPTWYSASWLYLECYMYRSLCDFVFRTVKLNKLDLFEKQKKDAYTSSCLAVRSLLAYLSQVIKNLQEGTESSIEEHFNEFLQVALWGNKCDLSISQGFENSQKKCLLEQLHHLKPNILVDDTNAVFSALHSAAYNRSGQPGRVDIVLDNAGFELVTDLCLAEMLIDTGLAACVHFHAKTLPWFISDVTEEDFAWTLDMMTSSDDSSVSDFGFKCKSRLQDGSWVLKSDQFWTLPYDFSEMKSWAPELYNDLAKADLIFFKGDLNYRKLVGDRQWDPTTSFVKSLRGFHPSPLCSLRALKADVVVGLQKGLAEEVGKKDNKWQVNGNWAIISFCGEKL